MRLYDVNIGRICTASEKKIKSETAHRLEMLGLTDNTQIRVLEKKGSAMIIKVRGTRIAVGKGIAQGIEVNTL